MRWLDLAASLVSWLAGWVVDWIRWLGKNKSQPQHILISMMEEIFYAYLKSNKNIYIETQRISKKNNNKKRKKNVKPAGAISSSEASVSATASAMASTAPAAASSNSS